MSMWEPAPGACYKNSGLLPCPCGNFSYGTIVKDNFMQCQISNHEYNCVVGGDPTKFESIRRRTSDEIILAHVFVPRCEGGMMEID